MNKRTAIQVVKAASKVYGLLQFTELSDPVYVCLKKKEVLDILKSWKSDSNFTIVVRNDDQNTVYIN